MHSLTRTHANTHAYTYQSNSTPLHFAANHGHASALDVLIAAKANLEAVDHVIHTHSLSFFLSLSLSLSLSHTHTHTQTHTH